MSKTKIFFSDVAGTHYRTGIFTLLDKYYDITWCFGKGNNSIPKIEDNLLNKVRRTDIVKLFSNWYWQRGIFKSLWKNYDYYILNGELYSLAVWAFIFLNKIFFRKKVYFWSHGWYGRESRLKKYLKSIYFSMPTGAFFYGNYARKIMQEEGLSVNNIYVVHNSLDYTKQLRLRKNSLSSNVLKEHFNNSNVNIIFIGRLTSSKKLDMIIDAVASLKKDNLFFNVTFVGEGEAKDKLLKLAKSQKVPCWFYGACYDEETNAKLIASADICVSPGNVGLTAIHSMMFGTPVITHDRFPNQGPEFEAIKQDETGGFFKENDTDSLSSAIKNWIISHKDRENIRQKCYAEIDSFWNPEYQLKIISDVIPFKM